MTTAEPIECERCHRKVRHSEPLWMLGKPYGPKCGRRYGLEPEKHPRVRSPAREPTGEDEDLLDGLAEMLRADKIDKE
jgi:hypothetical protein